MTDVAEEALEQRVERLERVVSRLQRQLREEHLRLIGVRDACALVATATGVLEPESDDPALLREAARRAP